MRITIRDVRRVFCVAGAKRWAEEHGVDFRAFIRDGMEESDLRIVINEDALLDRVVTAKQEAENGIIGG